MIMACDLNGGASCPPVRGSSENVKTIRGNIGGASGSPDGTKGYSAHGLDLSPKGPMDSPSGSVSSLELGHQSCPRPDATGRQGPPTNVMVMYMLHKDHHDINDTRNDFITDVWLTTSGLV